MKTLTLEEVKEYFKNAKEVRCLDDNKIYSFKYMSIRGIYGTNSGFWFDTTGGIDVKLFDKGRFSYAEIISYKDEIIDGGSCINDFNTPKYYDNSKGSLYQFCENQHLNSYEFDIIKRVMRCRKKGNFKEDLEKTKFLIDLYLKEYEK